MKYIVDKSKEFDGSVVTCMTDDEHCDYTGRTLPQIMIDNKNPRLVALEPEDVTSLVNKHRAKLNKEPFKEVDADHFYDAMDCLPPARSLRNAFFVGECYQYDLYPFLFTIDGRYFEGRRILNTPKEVLYAEINEFYANLTKTESHDN